ncbi:MAG: hypothetical protein FWD13_08310 [Treponema sp.]|nr:hypothetical protein [Treponema sp.]
MLNQTVKYTAILPKNYVNELRNMAEKKIIPSVNQGIRVAVEDFLKARNESEYKHNMREASKDETFNKRMMETMTAFEYADAKVDGEW